MSPRASRWGWVAVIALILSLAYLAGRCNGAGPAAAAVPPARGSAADVTARGVVLEPPDPARRARVASAAAAASLAVSAGLADGLWNERDRAALRAQLPYLDARTTNAVLMPLFDAINAQRARLDGPPL